MQTSTLPTPSVIAAAGARAFSKLRSKLSASADDNELADGAVIVKGAPTLEARATTTTPSAKDESLTGLLARAGIGAGVKTEGSTIRAAVTTQARKAEIISQDIKSSQRAKVERANLLAPPVAPVMKLTPERLEAARSLVESLDTVFDKALTQAAYAARLLEIDPKNMTPEQRFKKIQALSADQLLTEFLKLNISDPNESVETLNTLYDLTSKMRQMAIDEAQARIRRAQELMREAQKYADQAQQYADIAGMFGFAAIIMGPLGAIMSAMMQLIAAIANYEAQMMMADAKEEKNNGERHNFMGDMHQDIVQDTSKAISDIVQAKNDVVDSVLQMLNASFATQQLLMSATMAR